MWYTYILKCADGSLYAGSTTDMDRRVKEHNSGKGASYTRGRVPIELVYKKSHSARSFAQRHEAEIKKMPRPMKLSLISHYHMDR
ncbi:MAG: GIY-YIG nuclease family protein [Candidatus Omnitrophota bacterium]|nr:GIY-YIG nuclease family protein [Candidatus Omnitrophota bacterium]